ncbi:hypothetical protein EV714DRAFT_236808 [Schizophyllum commune]
MPSHPREIEGSSAASRVASIYELMHPIIRSVQNDELHGVEILVLLSTLSRFVGGIALDVLWEHLGDLPRLFCILPQVEARKLEYRQPQDDPTRARVIEGITPTILTVDNIEERSLPEIITGAQYARLQIYASRIRKLDGLNMRYNCPIIIHPRLLAAALAHGTLLPRLHTSHGPQTMFLFKDVRLRATESPARMSALVGDQVLGTLFPLANVRTLTLNASQGLLGLHVLRALPCLANLSIGGIGWGDAPLDDLPAATEPGFRALKKLDLIYPESLRAAAIALRALSSEPLELTHFAAEEWCREPDDDMDAARALFAAMRACIARDSLAHVRVATGLVGALPSHALLADLLAFPHIASAAVRWQSGGADIDGAVGLMCEAWPGLEELEILPDEPGVDVDDPLAPYTPRVTLHALIPLARHCPKLRRFFLSFLDVFDIPDPVEVPEDERIGTRPIVLQIMGSELSCDEVKPVTAFLTSLFPKGGIEHIDPGLSEEMWGRVCANMGIDLGKFDDFLYEKYAV